MEDSEERKTNIYDKVIQVGGIFRPSATLYNSFVQPLNHNKYILASTVSANHTGVNTTGIWALYLDGRKRVLLANLGDNQFQAYNLVSTQLSFKAVDTRTVAVVTNSHLLYLSVPSLAAVKTQLALSEGKKHPIQNPTKVAAFRRLPDHTFPEDTSSLKAKLFCDKEEIAFVDKAKSIVVIPLISQVLFVNLKSRKLIKTKRLQLREPTLKTLNVYPELKGSGKIVLVWWPGSPRPNVKCDIQLYDFRQDKIFQLLGPDTFTGNVPGHEGFSEAMFQDVLFKGDTIIISQTFFTARRFAHPHITVMKLEFPPSPTDSLTQEVTQPGGPQEQSESWVRIVSIRSYLINTASLYVELLGFSDDGSHILCTDMSRKFFSLSVDTGEHSGTFTPQTL